MHSLRAAPQAASGTQCVLSSSCGLGESVCVWVYLAPVAAGGEWRFVCSGGGLPSCWPAILFCRCVNLLRVTADHSKKSPLIRAWTDRSRLVLALERCLSVPSRARARARACARARVYV